MYQYTEEQFTEEQTEVYFTPEVLADRWSVTLHTLEQWRWRGRGPRFFKAGSLIRYPRMEVEKFETRITQTPVFDEMDTRFLCIDLGSSILTSPIEQGPVDDMGDHDPKYLKEKEKCKKNKLK